MPRLSSGSVLLAILLGLSACAPAREAARAPDPIPQLPPVPEVEGPLEISLAYPRPGAVSPDVDSTFIFGTVGTGEARLTVNGTRVPVAANGAFLAYLPVPEDEAYQFVARAGGQTETFTYTYARPAPPRPAVEAFEVPLAGVVVGGRDTLATGSEIAHAAPTPNGDRRWFFPPGTRLRVTGRSGDQLRLRLSAETEAWIDEARVRLGEEAPTGAAPIGRVTFEPQDRWVDVRVPAAHAPFLVVPRPEGVALVVYDRTAPSTGPLAVPAADAFIASAAWSAAADSANLTLALDEPLWGFKAFYEADGILVVRLRRPPPVAAAEPLDGLRVMVDPGHPPGGAVGPTGLTEAEANLAISLRLAELLRARGAEVLLTRTSAAGLVSDTDVAAELWGRVALAVDEDVDLLVSIHNNAFPEGVDPFRHYGTETYYFYPFSAPLAEALLQEILPVTGLPNLGAKQRSLALVRPSWMPSTLTESLFMMFPQQEAALANPAFVDRLAQAHLAGIVRFLRTTLRDGE